MRIKVSIKLDSAQARRLRQIAEQCGVTSEQVASTVAALALNHHLEEVPRPAASIAPRLEHATHNYPVPGSNPGRPTSHAFADTGFLRLTEIVGLPAKRGQPQPPRLIPVSRSTWLAGVKSGLYPKPVKLGPGVTAWRVEDIRGLIQKLDGQL